MQSETSPVGEKVRLDLSFRNYRERLLLLHYSHCTEAPTALNVDLKCRTSQRKDIYSLTNGTRLAFRDRPVVLCLRPESESRSEAALYEGSKSNSPRSRNQGQFFQTTSPQCHLSIPQVRAKEQSKFHKEQSIT